MTYGKITTYIYIDNKFIDDISNDKDRCIDSTYKFKYITIDSHISKAYISIAHTYISINDLHIHRKNKYIMKYIYQ